MKSFSCYCLLAFASTVGTVFAPSIASAIPIESRYPASLENSNPACYMETQDGQMLDLTRLCSSSSSAQSSRNPSTSENAAIQIERIKAQADITKAQLEALARAREANGQLINEAMRAGMQLSR